MTSFAESTSSGVIEPEQKASLIEAVRRIPLAFEQNQGQTDPKIKFFARGSSYDVLFTKEGADIFLGKQRGQKNSIISMRLVGANKQMPLQGLERLGLKTNYFVGTDAGQQKFVDISNFSRIKYSSVYPGVDLVFYGTQSYLEYDLIVAPKADPGNIKISFEGADRVLVTANGALRLGTASGDIEFRAPVAYQEVRGKKHVIDVAYAAAENQQIGFKLGEYDTEYPVVIDPILSFSSFFWLTPNAVAVDAAGFVYVVGSTVDTTLPAANGYKTRLVGKQDAYVVKIDTASAQVVYATYLGARRAMTSGKGIAVDAAGNAYITGSTDSTSYPVTSGAYSTSGSGSFVTKLNADGNGLVYSTYFPEGNVTAIAIDGGGNAYLAGTSGTLITTAGAFQTNLRASGIQSPFVAKLNAAGTGLAYATYVGGSGNDVANSVAVDGGGNAYLAGTTVSSDFPLASPVQPYLSGTRDAFISKLNPTGAALIYSSYLGGAADEYGNAVAVDAGGQAVIVGRTNSDNFPTTAGVFQRAKAYPGTSITNAFVAKLGATGSLDYASYLGGKWCLAPGVNSCFGLGGNGVDGATAVAVDLAGYAYVGGYTKSVSFPIVDALHPTNFNCDICNEPFVSKITPTGDRLVYSLVLGAENQFANINGIATGQDGSAYVVGAGSDNSGGTLYFPITAGTFLSSDTASVYSGILSKLSTGKYTIVLRSPGGTSAVGQNITFSADVFSLIPGGIVTFRNGSNTLGTAQVINGRASLTTMLPVGVHRITATFSGDGVTSPPQFQSVVYQ